MQIPKVIVITGASSGFGLNASQILAIRGHKVFGLSRRDWPRSPGVRMLVCDVRDEASVRTNVKAILAATGRIDVLVNNAGYSLTGFIEEAETNQAEALFNTNFFGAVRMTRAVLPTMRRQRSGTIINVSSLGGLIAVPGRGFYCASKSALEAYSDSLRHELTNLGIRISLVEPNHFNTGFNSAKVAATERIIDYDNLRAGVKQAAESDTRKSEDPSRVAELIAHIAECNKPRFRYQVGHKSHFYAFLRKITPDTIASWLIRRRFRAYNDGKDKASAALTPETGAK